MELVSARERVNGRAPASVKLGGTNVWARNAAALDDGIRDLSRSIEAVLLNHLTAARAVLKKQVQNHLGDLDDRVFGAVLGMCERTAHVDELVVCSMRDRPYRAYFHGSRVAALEHALQLARSALTSADSVQVRELESLIFGAHRYNTWSSSAHVLGHLAYTGSAEEFERGVFRQVAGLL
jgi:hypothetical protein